MFTLLNTLFAFAGPSRTTYQAKIVKPDGYPLESSNVNFKFTILEPAGCSLYAETFSNVNMGSSLGLVSFSLGSGVRVFPVSGSTFEQVFNNSTASLACEVGGIPSTYSPAANDTRKIVMQFNDGSGWQTLPPMTINGVPYAMYANDAIKFNGKDVTDFVQVASLPTCTASQAMSFNGVGFSCIAAGGSGSAVTSGSVITALGYTPASGVSFTALTSDLNSTNAEVALVSSTVFAVSSTLNFLSTSVSTLATSTAASFAAITSSQWQNNGASLFYDSGKVGIGTSEPTATLEINAPVSAASVSLFKVTDGETGGYFSVTEGSSTPNRHLPMFEYSSAAVSGYGGVLMGKIPGAYDIQVANGAAILVDGRTASNTTLANANLFLVRNYTTTRFVVQASGSVGIGTVTPVTKLDVAGGIKIGTENAICAPSFAGTLRYNSGVVEYCDGTSWSAFGVSGAGIMAVNGLTSGSQTFATGNIGTFPNISSTGSVHTFNFPSASAAGTLGGLLSYSDYSYFSNKADAVSLTTLSSTVTNLSNSTAASFTTLTSVMASSFSAITSSQWVSSGSTLYYPSGSVGIGTANPTSLLNVFQTQNSATTARVTNQHAGTAATAMLVAESDSGSVGLVMRSGSFNAVTPSTGRTNGAALFSATTASGGLSIAARHVSGVITLHAGGETERMRIDSTGYVGIGTAAPASKLHLYDNAPVLLTVERPSTANSLIEYKNTIGSIYAGLISGSSSWGIGTGTDLASTAVVQVTSSGRMYIGGSAISPTARLHITPGTSQVAPLKIGNGILLTSPQSGAIEYDGTNLYFTDNAGSRRALASTTTPGNFEGASIISNSGGNIDLFPNAGTGAVVVSATTASVNSSTGALIVKGGAGISGALNVGGVVSSSSIIKGTGFRANQGAPNAADNSTVGYAFGDDGDTGIFSPGSGSANGVLSFFTNNGERMRLTTSGALGIGVAPKSPLHVSNSSEFFKAIFGNDDNSVAESSMIKLDAAGSASNTAGIAFTSGGSQTLGSAIWRPSTTGGLFMKGLVTYTSMTGVTPDVYIDSVGNVAVGSGTTNYKFTAYKNFNGLSNVTAAFIGGNDAGTGNTGAYFVQKDNTGLSSNNTYLFNVVHSDVSRFMVTGNGNVGIGVSSPTERLQIQNSTGQAAVLIRGMSGATSTRAEVKLDRYDNPRGAGLRILDSNTGGSQWWAGVPYNGGGATDIFTIGRSVSQPEYLSNALLTVTAAGNVGIGTAAPASKLSIAGSSLEGILVDNGTSDSPNFILRDSTTSGTWNIDSSAGVLRFFTESSLGGGGGSERMVILPSGRVGIGTNSPVTNLHVRASNGSSYGAMMLGTDGGISNHHITHDLDGSFNVYTGTFGAGIRQFAIASAGAVTVTSMIRSESAAADTNLNRIPQANEIVLETAGNGTTSAWLWREKWAASNYGIFHDNSTDHVHFVGNNSPRLTVGLSNGTVGVGVSNPTATFHVNGTTRIVDGNQAAGRVLASDASGNAAWKQTIIHGTINSVGNVSNGGRVGSGVSITLPPGRWQITGMGITSPSASCRADFGIRNSATDAIVKYTLMPAPSSDYSTATVTGYVDIASTTTYDLYITSRGPCTSQVHVDNNLWELTATGVAY